MRARIADIVTAASEVFRINRGDIMGKRRVVEIVTARKAAYFAARLEGHSYPEIGRVMARDHSTVIHGSDGARWRYERDPAYSAMIDDIRQRAKVRYRPVARFPSHLERVLVQKQREQAERDRLADMEPAEWEHQRAMKRGSMALLEALQREAA